MRKFNIVFLFLMISTLGFAQIDKQADRIWLQGQLLVPVNEFDYEPGLKLSYLGRIAYRTSLSDMFSLEFGAGAGKLAGMDDMDWMGNRYYATTIVPVDARFLFTPFNWRTVRPYIYAGMGAMYFKNTTLPTDPSPFEVDEEGITAHAPFGIGVEFYITDGFAMELAAGGTMSFTESLNYYNNDDMFDGFGNVTLGVSIDLPRGSKDIDKDGLLNTDEEMMGTDPENPDSDGDGIIDGDEVHVYKTNPTNKDTDGDMLSDYEEIKNHKTDPTKADTDGDTLNDYEELNTYKTDPLSKDSDGDGLSDSDEVNKYNTDPNAKDTDKDGLTDKEEVLVYKTDPNKADSDADKLNDYDEVKTYKTDPLVKDTDKGSVEDGIEVERGTNPLLADDDVMKKEVAIVLEGIHFNVGSSEIKNESLPKLREALKTLQTYDDVTVEISGHTDNTGSKSLNQRLSQDRAESVKNWLVKNGIDAERIVAVGYGEDRPIADNSTADGRLQNRRIEFKRIK